MGRQQKDPRIRPNATHPWCIKHVASFVVSNYNTACVYTRPNLLFFLNTNIPIDSFRYHVFGTTCGARCTCKPGHHEGWSIVAVGPSGDSGGTTASALGTRVFDCPKMMFISIYCCLRKQYSWRLLGRQASSLLK